MAVTREQNAVQLSELTEQMKKSQSVIFAHYIGLTVGNVSDLRKKLRAANAEMKVAKKTLIRLAASQAGLPAVADEALPGPVACIFSFADPLTGAQVAFSFAKEHQQVALVCGVFDGKVLTKEQAVALAKMPGRQQLLGMFASMLRAPLSQFASISSTPLRSFAVGLSQMAEKKASAPSA